MKHTQAPWMVLMVLVVTGVLITATQAIAEDVATSSAEVASSSDAVLLDASSTPSQSSEQTPLIETVLADTASSTANLFGDGASSSPAHSTPPLIEEHASSTDASNEEHASSTDSLGSAQSPIETSPLITKTSPASTSTSTPFDLSATGTPVETHTMKGNTASSSSASTTPKMRLTCTMAYTADLYDTPSGHLDEGYVAESDATPDTPKNRIARIVGTQSWTVCRNNQGKTFEFKMTPTEYKSVSHDDAQFAEREL